MKILLNMQIAFGERVISEQQLQLLAYTASLGSIKAAASRMQISYKNAWDKLRAINEIAGFCVIDSTQKRSGSKLTPQGKELLSKYLQFQEFAKRLDEDFGPKMSAQNRLKVEISSIVSNDEGALIGAKLLGAKQNGNLLYAQISQSALNQLKISVGQQVFYVFKVFSLRLCKEPLAATKNCFKALIIQQKALKDGEFSYLIDPLNDLGDKASENAHHISNIQASGVLSAMGAAASSDKQSVVGQIADFYIDPANIIIML